MHEHSTVDTQGGAAGISRRDMLRKSAVVGGAGALMWAAPSITKFGSAAFGETEGTPVGKELSYVAIEYDCNPPGGDDNDLRGVIKFNVDEDEHGNPTLTECNTPAGGGPNEGELQTPGCPFDDSAGNGPLDCDDFAVSFPNNDLYTVDVCLSPSDPGHEDDCILSGVGVGMCGGGTESPSDQEQGDCVTGTLLNDQCIRFNLCFA